MNRINCPLCDWHLDPQPPDVPYNALADVFGLGVMSAIAYNEHLRKVESQLQAHLDTHALVEWVRKVADLQAEIDRLTQADTDARAAAKPWLSSPSPPAATSAAGSPKATRTGKRRSTRRRPGTPQR